MPFLNTVKQPEMKIAFQDIYIFQVGIRYWVAAVKTISGLSSGSFIPSL
jgi:hypothetical protein